MADRPPGRPKGSKTKDPEQRRREIVDAAVAAVRKVGHEASMVDIASEAGITKSVLYDHFDSKEALQGAVVERYGERLGQIFARGVDADRTPAALLRDSLQAFVAFVERDPEVFRFVSRGANDMLDESAPVFAALIGHSLRRAGHDSGGAEVFAHAMLGATFAATERWVARPTMGRADFVDYLLAVLWDGLAGVGLRVDELVDMTPAIQAIARAELANDGSGS